MSKNTGKYPAEGSKTARETISWLWTTFVSLDVHPGRLIAFWVVYWGWWELCARLELDQWLCIAVGAVLIWKWPSFIDFPWERKRDEP